MTEGANNQLTMLRGKESEIKPLTSFRFFAVLFVFLSHLSIFEIFPELKYIYDRFFYEGYVGVTFFFVLSGFILTYKYHSRIASLQVSELKSFYVSRIARIYPVHVLTFVVALPLVYQTVPTDLIGEGIRALLNLSLLQGFIPDVSYFFAYNAPAWSLSDEVFFYALFPFVMALLLRARLTTARRAVALGIGLWLVALAGVWSFRDIETSHWLFYIAPFSRLFDFLIGVLSCIVFLKIRNGVNTSKIVFTLLELFSLAAFFFAFYVSPAVHQSLRYGVYYTPFIFLIIVSFAMSKGHLSDLLSARLLVLGGEISFSFYLLHQLVIRYFLGSHFFDPDPVFAAIVAFLLTASLSYICYSLYESPARDKLRHRFAARREVAASRVQAAPSVSSANSDALTPAHTTIFPAKFAWSSVVAMTAIVLVTYYPSLRLGFLGEIWTALEAAGRLNMPQYVVNVLDSQNFAPAYQVLPAVLLFVGYQVFHADSLGYHVLNLFLHLATVWLFFWTILEIGKNSRVAILSSLIFAGLSIFSQSVFNPIDPYLVMGPVYLLGVWSWVKFLQTTRRKFYLLTVTALGIALFIIPASATLVITLFAVDRLLIRSVSDQTKLFSRYRFLCLLTVSLLGIEFLVRGGSSTVSLQFSVQALVNLAEYLALLMFPWGFDFPIIFAFAPLVAAGFVLVAARKRSAVMLFLGVETVLLLIPYAFLPRESFTPRVFYLPAMVFAVAFALLFSCLWGESGYNRRHVVTAAAGALALVVLFNATEISAAATEWANVVRRTRQVYREITPLHPTFSDDTYLYFIGPTSVRDLSGLFYFRYGDRVLVASSHNDSSLSHVPYPSLQKTESAVGIKSGSGQVAALRRHKTSFVYYFADDGKTVQVPVAPEAPTASTPQLPVTFNAPIRLEGYEITANTLKTGDVLVFLFYWRATRQVDKNYTVFVHLLNDRGEMVDGYDSQPQGGRAPTSHWQPGALIVDSIAFRIDRSIPRGTDYQFGVGLYDAATSERSLLVDDHGTPYADQILIKPFQVK